MVYILGEDEKERELIVYSLLNTGMQALGFSDPAVFSSQMEQEIPSLLIMDSELTRTDAFLLLQKLRSDAKTEQLPIIMTASDGSEYDKIKAFENGADDYMIKPFGMMELIARVKALLRRNGAANQKECIRVNGLEVYPRWHKAFANGEPVELTMKEFELLMLLISNPRTVFTREEIREKIWEYIYDGGTRTVDVHICTLRQKLGTCGSLIKTVRGIGYCLSD